MEKSDNQTIELRGSERVFQIDRDTYLIYTGRDKGDLRPFVRTGAGESIPNGFLGQIENVLLLEKNPVNIALELAWLEETLKEVNQPIHYVGSRDRVSQIYNLTGMAQIDEEADRPVKMDPFVPPKKGEQLEKNKSTVQFFENGNARLLVGSSRVYDYSALLKTKNSIDKEYEKMSKAMLRLPKKCNNPESKSFLYVGKNASGDPLKPCIFWNFNSNGVMVNPVMDYHAVLFENKIDVNSVMAVVSNSAITPGISEAYRRNNELGSQLGVYTADEDRQSVLKKIYSQAKIKNMEDGVAIPGIKDTVFFVSRKGSHGAFGYKISDENDEVAQILFPIGGAKYNHRFDYIKSPHDLEILTCRTNDELKKRDVLANLTLVLPGKMDERTYHRKKLATGIYPLVKGREYKLHGFSDHKSMIDQFLRAFENTTIKAFVQDLLFLHIGLDVTESKIHERLKTIAGFDIITDPVKLNNLNELLRYLPSLPAFITHYNKENHRLLKRCQKKFNVRHLSFLGFLELGHEDIEFDVLFAAGKSTYLLINPAEKEPAIFKVPPEISNFEKAPKDYKRFLTRQNRKLDKIGDIPGYRQCLEYLESLNEESLQLVYDRKRFLDLINQLGISAEDSKKKEPKPAWYDKYISFVKKYWDTTGKTLKFILAGFVALLICAGLYLFISSFGGEKIASQTTNGGSVLELQAVSLVSPGEVQEELLVPGEQNIMPAESEIFVYSNSLASRNGFRKLNQIDKKNLKNPDLVFPGERLKLPDGRIAQVRPKDYIWELAKIHYKKDFARIQILNNQKTDLIKQADATKNKKDKQAIYKKIKGIEGSMKRLAVTPKMKSIGK